ncbi:MAG: hypothetical protein HY329_15305 [Chloroflexi bacterium]|nr:hypothetical protein [Chloroflexota bacterium]
MATATTRTELQTREGPDSSPAHVAGGEPAMQSSIAPSPTTRHVADSSGPERWFGVLGHIGMRLLRLGSRRPELPVYPYGGAVMTDTFERDYAGQPRRLGY